MALDLDKIASELSTLFVAVTDQDANDYKRLQKKLIVCNANQDVVVRYLTSIEPMVAKQENAINTQKFVLNARKQDIKTNTAKVKNMPTGKERDEAAEELLHKDYQQMINMENNLNDLRTAKNALVTTLRKLKTTEQNIKLLKSMLDEQVSKLNVGAVGDPDVADLQKSLSELDNLDDQLEDEIGLDDDVEKSEDFIENKYSEADTQDESEQPSNEPLDSQDSREDSEDLLDMSDVLDSTSDESEQPSIEPLDSQDSHDEPTDTEDSTEEDLISSLVNDDDLGFDPYGEDDSDFKIEEEVTEKQPKIEESKDESKTEKSKRTPIEEILNEDLPEDGPVQDLVDDEIDMSDFITDTRAGKPAASVKVESKVEPKKVVKKEDPVVEDDASIGVEYDIESLLDM